MVQKIMKNTFNQKNISDLPIPKSNYKLYRYEHSKDSGLAIKVTSKGTKSYIVVFQDGTRKKIGNYSDTKLTDALAMARDYRNTFSKGEDVSLHNKVEDIRTPTLNEMAVKYLGWSVNHKKKLSIQSDTERLRNHILPAIGNREVDAISTRDISAFLNSLINKEHKYPRLKSINGVSIKSFSRKDFVKVFNDCGINACIVEEDLDNIDDPVDIILAKYIDELILTEYFKDNASYYYITRVTTEGTANKCKALLSHMYNTAMLWPEPEWACVKTNPCKGLKSSKTNSKTRYLDKSELSSLENVLSMDKYKTNNIANLIKFLIKTGARRSEAINARWEHIDFINKMWRKPDTKSKTKLAPPVPLSNSAIELLHHIQSYSGSLGYIFKSNYDDTKPIGDFRKSFEHIMKEAKIEKCTPHDLRRTFGTQLLLAGVDIYTVSKLLGHNSVATTEKHYAFLNRETLHNAVNVLDGIL
tara:strand:+ start:270 stop:1682 length:1413 start_codon:yes stop_codon:yes gene_type:complete